MALDEILLLTNGPGELSTWVPPVLRRLRVAEPSARLELFLVRDQFSAGTEAARARELDLDAVYGRAELLGRIASRKPRGRGRVLMLGGAPRDAALLGRALGYPAFVYSFDHKAWYPGLSGLMVDSERTRKAAVARGADAAKTHTVGNLVRDAMEDARGGGDQAADVLIFPSSRPFAARYLLGFMLAAAERMAAARPGLRFGWVRSRLLTDAAVGEALSGRFAGEIGGVSARLEGAGQGDEGRGHLLTQNGLRVEVVSESARYSAMAGAKVAVTIPGTNTLELALAGLPAVVLLPLHKPELLPLEGVLHWLFMLPGGRGLKQRFVLGLERRVGHLALPNQWLGERVFPELRGVFGPDAVAEAALELLEPARRQQIRTRLQDLDAPPGADNLVRKVLE
ncbi:MAG: sugar synthetase [Meiothermus sp.]|nr:sugar synthetase [Meiothermus sp.]